MKSKFFLLGAHISVAFNVINGGKSHSGNGSFSCLKGAACIIWLRAAKLDVKAHFVSCECPKTQTGCKSVKCLWLQ